MPALLCYKVYSCKHTFREHNSCLICKSFTNSRIKQPPQTLVAQIISTQFCGYSLHNKWACTGNCGTTI